MKSQWGNLSMRKFFKAYLIENYSHHSFPHIYLTQYYNNFTHRSTLFPKYIAKIKHMTSWGSHCVSEVSIYEGSQYE